MKAADLNNMTVVELRELRERIDIAIRAAIARSRVKVEAQPAAPPQIDLERERDAWTARRR